MTELFVSSPPVYSIPFSLLTLPKWKRILKFNQIQAHKHMSPYHSSPSSLSTSAPTEQRQQINATPGPILSLSSCTPSFLLHHSTPLHHYHSRNISPLPNSSCPLIHSARIKSSCYSYHFEIWPRVECVPCLRVCDPSLLAASIGKQFSDPYQGSCVLGTTIIMCVKGKTIEREKSTPFQDSLCISFLFVVKEE